MDTVIALAGAGLDFAVPHVHYLDTILYQP